MSASRPDSFGQAVSAFMSKGEPRSFKCLEVLGFIIRRSCGPATIQYADPFKRQGSHSRLVRGAFRSLLIIIQASPVGLIDRLCSPLNKGLAQEGWALSSPVDPVFLAAAFSDRCDARVFLQCGRIRKAFALFTKGDQQPRSE